MARQGRSQNCFLRHEGAERRDVYFRINPIAIRFQQGKKGSVTETLGGYFREVMSSKDAQYNLQLADLTIEATTGIAYRKELETIAWIWRHSSDRKKDGSPADTYFYDQIDDAPYQGIARSGKRAWLIEIANFAWDDTTQSPYEIKFSMRCKVLRDLFWGVGDVTGNPEFANVPNLSALATAQAQTQRIVAESPFTIPDITQITLR